MTPEQQARVLDEARSWLGTPYVHSAGVKGAGVDCAMLLVRVYHNAGIIPDIDPRGYSTQWHLHRTEEKYLEWIHQHADRVETPEPGDVVLFRFGRAAAHGGIVVNWPSIIHSYLGVGCILDSGEADYLHGRLYGFYRVRA